MRCRSLSTSVICVVLAACSPTSAQTSKAPTPKQFDARCDPVGAVERVEVGQGETVRTESGLAITYASYQHDLYEDGADAWAELEFKQVLDDGTLSESAFSWSPSLYAKPRFEYLDIGRCARATDAGSGKLVLELFKPAGSPNESLR
jgi:hypothetical protein